MNWKREANHMKRHTFATMMLTLGADLYTTSKLLGHADVKMTQYQMSIRKSANARKSRRMNNYTVEYPENK